MILEPAIRQRILLLLAERRQTGQPTVAAIAARCGVGQSTVFKVAKESRDRAAAGDGGRADE
jgi:DNA-binding MurR/RpiR family transcriptional regulator